MRSSLRKIPGRSEDRPSNGRDRHLYITPQTPRKES
jgi:hypothetical protein